MIKTHFYTFKCKWGNTFKFQSISVVTSVNTLIHVREFLALEIFHYSKYEIYFVISTTLNTLVY